MGVAYTEKYDYFKIVETTTTDYPIEPDCQTYFRGSRRIMLVGKVGTNVEYSFDGVTTHGRISADQIIHLNLRIESKIWFKGTGTVDVHMWQAWV